MAVTEPQRLDLHAAARAALGPEEGDTLMASLPPANTDIATRQDLERIETLLRADLERTVERSEERLRGEIAASEQRLRGEIAASEQRLQGHTWKVALGTAAGLALTTVSLTLGGIAIMVQVLGLA
jgi:hypothetical protein